MTDGYAMGNDSGGLLACLLSLMVVRACWTGQTMEVALAE